ncbi:LysE family transporter [Candidatus Bathyarchaeota archaeon]|nr:LysE family transporter [Candidatus Bathyarchaeota archaeon]
MLLFLLSVIAISLSGVMMPGPIFAVTVAKGKFDGNAGLYIALGHGIIEFPLIILIYFGFSQFFTYEIVKKTIGFIGGLMLLYMGFLMFKTRKKVEEKALSFNFNSLIAGVVATGANPYFLLWWATIGAALVSNATSYGLSGFIIFALTHWICDLTWDLLISKIVYKSKRFWNEKMHKAIFICCALILFGFGLWFIISSL